MARVSRLKLNFILVYVLFPCYQRGVLSLDISMLEDTEATQDKCIDTDIANQRL